ncbi:MAG: rane protein [Frankiales bacterium]|nr:rane protein [Frankiales bacterium]
MSSSTFRGLNPTMLEIELRRVLRNKRTAIFTLIMPVVLFEVFGSSQGTSDKVGDGNVTAYILISMAVYGAMLAATAAGASVSLERAAGWSRQLRLTPLAPAAYITAKVLSALVISATSVAVVYLVGTTSKAQMPTSTWFQTALLAWVCSMVFAAFGLFMGYLLPSENVMQALGPGLALMSFAGGLFIPLSQYNDVFRAIAKVTPVYGVGELARYPLVHDGRLAGAIVNVVTWTLVFGIGAAMRFRRDTARV